MPSQIIHFKIDPQKLNSKVFYVKSKKSLSEKICRLILSLGKELALARVIGLPVMRPITQQILSNYSNTDRLQPSVIAKIKKKRLSAIILTNNKLDEIYDW